MYIIYKIDKDNFLLPVKHIRNYLIIISLLFLSAAFISFRIYAIKLVSPIERLCNISEDFIQGKEISKWPEGNYYEIINLVKVLKSLVNQLHNTNIELLDKNSKLYSSVIKEKRIKKEIEDLYLKTKNANTMLHKTQNELRESNNKLEKALKDAEKANILKDEFLANMSHEIRTPLTAIIGFNSLMLMDKNLTEEQIENIKLIEKAGKRLMNLLMNILMTSKIEAGKIKVNKKVVDLEKIFKDLYDTFALKIKGNNIDFSYNLNSIKHVYTDEMRLFQILLNLTGNAIKFTAKGKIFITVEQIDDFYKFSVKDTGQGIDPKIYDEIFDSFVSGEIGFTKKYDGAGLGLNICKRLTKLLGGKIWFDSVLGEGSTFYFKIPIEKQIDNQQLEKEDNFKNEKKVLSKKNIVVIDDEDVILQFVDNALLKITKHNIQTYSSARNFLNEFDKDHKVDLILLDIRMPEIDGMLCFEKIREIDENIPVIALTAFALSNDKEKILNKGFTDYVSKPINLDELIHKINYHISNK